MNWVKEYVGSWFQAKRPEIMYQSFQVQNFKSIDDVTIELRKANLVLLLGLNESGKTSLLKSIEAFDHRNDPELDSNSFFSSMRNKKDPNSNKTVKITANLEIKSTDSREQRNKKLKNVAEKDKDDVDAVLDAITSSQEVKITRCIEFRGGLYQRSYHRIDVMGAEIENKDVQEALSKSLVSLCPFVIYFEDFKDRIPEKIYISPKSEAHDSGWTDIIEGVFHHTDSSFSVKQLQKFYSSTRNSTDDARTVMKRVNKTLNNVFTRKWQDLSGVADIESAELEYHHSPQRRGRFFQIKITDSDGTTYSVDERSKGALWYLSFLMKTEFRRKKLRGDSGKPIFLIDEPASNLHSTAQRNMIEDFKKLVEDTCVIYTTHSQYLISLDNIKNTYVVRRKNGMVECTKWGKFIKGKGVSTEYYQPLADVLQLIPNNFDMPCQKALLTEGPSDMNFIYVMASVFNNYNRTDVAIYPGSSASNLDALISLNIGWGATFKVILDGDDEGYMSKERYKTNHMMSDDDFIMLPDGKEIEDLISADELHELGALVDVSTSVERINKKEFAMVFARLRESRSLWKDVESMLSPPTVNSFREIISNAGVFDI